MQILSLFVCLVKGWRRNHQWSWSQNKYSFFHTQAQSYKNFKVKFRFQLSWVNFSFVPVGHEWQRIAVQSTHPPSIVALWEIFQILIYFFWNMYFARSCNNCTDCVFWPAFGCYAHPKAGWKICLPCGAPLSCGLICHNKQTKRLLLYFTCKNSK